MSVEKAYFFKTSFPKCDRLSCNSEELKVVEALLVAIYSTWGTSKYLLDIGKPCRSRTCLVRYSCFLSSCAFPAGPCPTVPLQLIPVQLRYTNVRAHEPANSARHAAYLQHVRLFWCSGKSHARRVIRIWWFRRCCIACPIVSRCS